MPHKFSKGLTLIELIISIVILGIALGASVSNMGALLKNSIDPIIRIQGYYIMKAYMDEISSKLAQSPCTAKSSSLTRTDYSTCDYDKLSEIPTNPAGVIMNGKTTSPYTNFNLPNLSNYQISVQIISASSLTSKIQFTDDSDSKTNTRTFLKITITGKYNNSISLGTLSTYVAVPQ